MITKVVTEDFNGNTHIYRYKINTYSEKVSAKCEKCGKRISHSVPFQYQGTPSKEDWERLEEKKKAWLEEKHICASCLKQACKGEQKPLEMFPINAYLDDITNLSKTIKEIEKAIDAQADRVKEALYGRVCLYEDKEYVVKSVYNGSNSSQPYCLRAEKIDTRYPWLTTDTELYITPEGKGWGTGRSVSAKFEDVTFTDEVFSERRERVKQLTR